MERAVFGQTSDGRDVERISLRNDRYHFSVLTYGATLYSFGYDDVIFRISRRWSAFRAPYSDDEKRIIEAGGIPPERSGYGLSIPAGDYSLLQTVPVEDEKKLRSVAMTIAGRYRCGTMYVRMFKENPLECVMQIFVPGRLPQDLD